MSVVVSDVPRQALQGCLLGGGVLFLCGWLFRLSRGGLPVTPEVAMPPSAEAQSDQCARANDPYSPPAGQIASVAVPPPLPVSGVPTHYYRPYDFLWGGAIYLLFSWQVLGAVREPGKEAGPEISALALMVGIAMQLMFLIVTVGVMAMRVSIIRWLGLRWRHWRWVFLIGPGGVLLMWAMMTLVYLTGYTSWAMSFGEGYQEAVKLLQEGRDPLVLGLMAVAAVLVAPVCEEVVFRGYLYPLAKKYSGRWVAAIATSLVFAAAHGNLGALLPLFLLALFLVALYEVTGSLWAPIAVHLCFNGATVALQMLARVYDLPLNPPS